MRIVLNESKSESNRFAPVYDFQVKMEDVRKQNLWRTEDFEMEREFWVEEQVKKMGSVAWGQVGHEEVSQGPDGADEAMAGVTQKVHSL